MHHILSNFLYTYQVNKVMFQYLRWPSETGCPYLGIFCFQTPPPAVHQATLCRGYLLPRADRAKRGHRFWRGEHQGPVEVGAGAHGESNSGFSRRGIQKNYAIWPVLVNVHVFKRESFICCFWKCNIFFSLYFSLWISYSRYTLHW